MLDFAFKFSNQLEFFDRGDYSMLLDREKMNNEVMEGAYVEFTRGNKLDGKKLHPDDWKKFAKEVCAFANTDGGILVIGYDQTTGPTPIENLYKYMECINKDSSNSIEPPVKYEVKHIPINPGENKGIVYVVVYPSKLLHRTTKSKEIYVRSGETSTPLPWSIVTQLLTGQKSVVSAKILFICKATRSVDVTGKYKYSILIRAWIENTSPLLPLKDAIVSVEESNCKNLGFELLETRDSQIVGRYFIETSICGKLEKVRPREQCHAFALRGEIKEDAFSNESLLVRGYVYAEFFPGLYYSLEIPSYFFDDIKTMDNSNCNFDLNEFLKTESLQTNN